MMNRRDAIARVAVIMGGTVLGAEAFLSGCTTAPTGLKFSKQDIAFLNEVAETILPTTKTPGAKAAKVGEFMSVMVTDCYDQANQLIFTQGIQTLNTKYAVAAVGKSFMDASPEQRHQILVSLDEEAKAYKKSKKPDQPKHYFTMMKELTLTGYFTSEIGATQALRYIAVPGKFEGCVPYAKGDKAWAT